MTILFCPVTKTMFKVDPHNQERPDFFTRESHGGNDIHTPTFDPTTISHPITFGLHVAPPLLIPPARASPAPNLLVKLVQEA